MLLFAHVLAAVVTIGPTMMAASRFPRAVADGNTSLAEDLRRATARYGTASLSVPALGIILLTHNHGLPRTAWIATVASLVAAQYAALLAGVLPAQRKAITSPDRLGPCRGWSGAYNLAWAATLLAMIAKPWYR